MSPRDKTCRSCGADIEWAVTAKRRFIPLDPGENALGNLAVNEAMQARVLAGDEQEHEGETRMISHFATCPNAKQHRRKGKW